MGKYDHYYQILGVSPYASDDEIKQAYRSLAKKYHPDRYVNSPLAESASEKMKEINNAYDSIMDMRKNGGGAGKDSFNYRYPWENYSPDRGRTQAKTKERTKVDFYTSYYDSAEVDKKQSYADARFRESRAYIQKGDYTNARRILDTFLPTERDGEWHYQMGLISYAGGRMEEAYNYFSAAYDSDPFNREYAAMYDILRQRRTRSKGIFDYAGTSDCNSEVCREDFWCLEACCCCLLDIANRWL